jgi:signal transduction histidine kinase
VSIRIKIAAASTAATLVLLLGAGFLFLTTLSSGLQNSLDNSLRIRADELSAQVNPDGSLRAPASVALQLADDSYGQVFSAQGQVLQSTAAKENRPLLNAGQLASARRAAEFFNVAVPEGGPAGRGHQVRVLATPVGRSGTVAAVGMSRDVVDEAVERAGRQLLILGAVVLIIAAPGSWFLARGALKPVDRMRAQAAELQAHDAEGGLTVPTSRDEINRLALTFNALLGRLHSALEREKAFVADAGHELRTPLTVLRGELELARRPGRTKAELQQSLEVAGEETERLIRLAEDLLVLAADDSSAMDRWVRFDVGELVSTACERAASLATPRDVTVLACGDSSVLADGDPARMRQAVDNVLANALRVAPAGSTIEAEVRAGAHDRVSIEVRDSGPGFPREVLPVAFERFRRADVARTRLEPGERSDSGTGLGLAIVRSVLRAHGGDAVAENRPGGVGASVVLSWPAHRSGPAPGGDRR